MARDRRLVVLDGVQRPLQVRLDGRALRVTLENTAEHLIPLARIDRIMTRGNVMWTASALAATAAEGAQIAFLLGNGQTAALLTGASHEANRAGASQAVGQPLLSPDLAKIEQTLEHIAQRADWPGRIEDFCLGELSRAARAYGIRDGATAARQGWSALEQALRQELRATGFGPALSRDARSFLEAWTRRRMTSLGVPLPWLGVNAGGRFDLAGPFAAIVGWAAMPLLARRLQYLRSVGKVPGTGASDHEFRLQCLLWAELSTPRLLRLFHALCTRFMRMTDEMLQDSRWNEAPLWDG